MKIDYLTTYQRSKLNRLCCARFLNRYVRMLKMFRSKLAIHQIGCMRRLQQSYIRCYSDCSACKDLCRSANFKSIFSADLAPHLIFVVRALQYAYLSTSQLCWCRSNTVGTALPAIICWRGLFLQAHSCIAVPISRYSSGRHICQTLLEFTLFSALVFVHARVLSIVQHATQFDPHRLGPYAALSNKTSFISVRE